MHDIFCEKQIRTFDILLCSNQNIGTRKDYIRAKEQFTKILEFRTAKRIIMANKLLFFQQEKSLFSSLELILFRQIDTHKNVKMLIADR